jgi:atypical dual specificity phosphatase
MKEPILALRGFGVAFGDRPVLADVTLEIPRRGLVVLMGPSGSGKSTLLRTLAGLNDAHPSLTRWGVAELDGQPLFGPGARTTQRRGIGVMVQHSRFYMNTVRENLVSALPNRSSLARSAQTEVARRLLVDTGLGALVNRLDAEVVGLPQTMQRMLAIVRATAGDPGVLLADEPTSGLEDDAAIEVLALLRAQAVSRGVLLVTHNQRHARAAGGSLVLLAGGRIVEQDTTAEFFAEPKTASGKTFVATGGCSLPTPGASADDLDEDSPRATPLPPEVTETLRRGQVGPRGFFWVIPNRLGGVPRPGIVWDLADDLAGLRALGVTVLVTLEETATVEPGLLASLGIESIHFPVADMGAPAIAPARELCITVEARLARGDVVALHCRAGLGRTGTLLASQLVWNGETAVRAIDRIRMINPRCIQSDEQVRFLRLFEQALRPRSHAPAP